MHHRNLISTKHRQVHAQWNPPPFCPAPKFEAMAVGLTVRAALLLALAQFFVQDTKGQVFGPGDCLANITKAYKKNIYIEVKLSEVLRDWRPSLMSFSSYWAFHDEYTICSTCRNADSCRQYLNNPAKSKGSFQELIKQVYGRKIAQNFIINVMIRIGKLALSCRAGGAKVGSDVIQLLFEYFDFPLTTVVAKAVGLVGSTYAGAKGCIDN